MFRLLPLAKSRKDDDESGYFTLEAAIVATTSTLLVTAFIWLGIYLVDLGMAAACLNEMAVKQTLEKTESYDSIMLKRELEEQLLVGQLVDCSFSRKAEFVNGHVELSLNIPIPLLKEWTETVFRNTISVSLENGDTVRKIRRWDWSDE